uniref:Uncharacterized protein n=1 Tax=Noctiluca scintillans TaxID=2966 RepID=A0A7S1A620_NOCSC|mmetsp:Transcript_33096/g.88692  ORF Transcript_33096/g.88692 Transcript_33096/m.88692 type:complete len:106 (+) Transcript_33096:179-496(+)
MCWKVHSTSGGASPHLSRRRKELPRSDARVCGLSWQRMCPNRDPVWRSGTHEVREQLGWALNPRQESSGREVEPTGREVFFLVPMLLPVLGYNYKEKAPCFHEVP